MSRPNKLPAEKAAAIVADYLAGGSTTHVAAAHGVATETVARYVRRAGHKMRPPHYRGRCCVCDAARGMCACDEPLTNGRWVLNPARRVLVWIPGGEVA